MDAKAIKKMILFAKKHGVKSMTTDGLTFELFESTTVRVQSVRRIKTAVAPGSVQEEKGIKPDPVPTLDEINQFIYQQPREESA